MDHAAAHEHIETLLLDPRRLASLEASTAPEDVALREHVAGCTACRADLDAWRGLGAAMSASLPRSATEAADATEPVELPPSMRATVLAMAHAEPRSPRVAAGSPAAGTTAPRSIDTAPSRRTSRLGPLLALAASLIVVVGSSALVLDQAKQRDTAQAQAAALTSALSAVDRVLAEPEHRIVQLHQPDGTTAGSISWSRHDWVVLTTALAPATTGNRYDCWLVDENGASFIGTMQFAGDTAFWASSVDKWATWEIKATTRFVVTLQPATDASLSGPTLLEAALGG